MTEPSADEAVQTFAQDGCDRVNWPLDMHGKSSTVDPSDNKRTEQLRDLCTNSSWKGTQPSAYHLNPIGFHFCDDGFRWEFGG